MLFSDEIDFVARKADLPTPEVIRQLMAGGLGTCRELLQKSWLMRSEKPSVRQR